MAEQHTHTPFAKRGDKGMASHSRSEIRQLEAEVRAAELKAAQWRAEHPEPEQYEAQRKASRRSEASSASASSKRSSVRHSAAKPEDKLQALIDQIKELCGCGRKTVRE
jgi:hypothetical protein